jgi:hypothetical protein
MVADAVVLREESPKLRDEARNVSRCRVQKRHG